MTVAQIAVRLAVSRRTVRRMFERHELRGVRIGHQWRARAEDVDQLATPADPVSRSGAGEKSAASGLSDASAAAVWPAPAFDQGIRINAGRPPWETQTAAVASSAAGRARSAGKRKSAARG